MPRPLLKDTIKSEYVIDENHKPSSKAIKFKKSVTTTSRKFNSTVKNRDRLVGGADAPEEQKDILKLPEETEEKTRTAGPCCTCLAQVPGSTGDKKVDEIIDYVHQNLQEAGKALATLGENFEHDSKVEPCTQVKPS
ncbi:uncharacterized protein LOC102676697 isoform X3 [Apis dorsata]|uniref:uncharacterized protein LOC102676697 isoform X3 n=1 Tax=Apis dorsata TaxID=7462 RepID=UPI00129401F9|nr:uncharacterized protein LOC102676697 isoform X3 [Apis dorsata]